MARNYYLILGVDPDASLEQIRSAYRRKAMELHPDRYEGSSKPFRDVQEAYETLCDPTRRECYDAELLKESRARSARSRPSRTFPVEPLIPDDPVYGWGERPTGASRYAPVNERLDGRWDEWDAWLDPIDRDRVEDQVVIPLTRAQARRGGRARLWIAIPFTCPSCRGLGGIGFYACEHCYGQGTIVEQRPVWIEYPPGIADRSVAWVSLARLGEPDATLIVRFSVRG